MKGDKYCLIYLEKLHRTQQKIMIPGNPSNSQKSSLFIIQQLFFFKTYAYEELCNFYKVEITLKLLIFFDEQSSNDKDTKYKNYIKQQAKCLRGDIHKDKKVFVLMCKKCAVNLETARLKFLKQEKSLDHLYR